jgi:hypothetical protein
VKLPTSGRHRVDALLVFLLALVLYLATTGGSMATDIMSYEVAKNIVEHGSVAMSYNVHNMDAHRGADGRYYSPYGIGHPIYAVPFYLAGRVTEQVTGLGVGKPEAIRKAFFVLGNAVAAALTVWLTFLFALRLGGTSRAAAATALTLGFATLLWPYARMGFNAPLSALTVLWGTYSVWVGARDRRQAMLWFGGVGFACALLVRHELVLATVPAGLWILFESRGRLQEAFRKTMPVAIPVAAALLLTLYYNQVRFGNPWDTGYLRDGTTTFGPLWVGLLGFVASPGRSLFLFAPVTLLGLPALAGMWRRDRATAVLLGGNIAVLTVFYASQLYWDADRSYGPRYLVAILPFLCLPLAAWFDLPRSATTRRVLVGVVAISVLAQAPGVLVDFSKAGYRPEHAHLTYESRLWTWEGSGFVLNAKAAVAQIPLNLRYLTGSQPRPVIRTAEYRATDFSEQFAFSLDVWWLYLFYARAISAAAAIAAFASLLALAAALANALARHTRPDTTDPRARLSRDATRGYPRG